MTPVTSDEPADYTDLFDDVFGSAPASPTLHASASVSPVSAEQRLQASDPSDIPRLRSIHVTNGYREGIAASKETYIQQGFDEGYALGAEVGLLAGWCLGALEGIWHSVPKQTDNESAGATSDDRGGQVTRDKAQKLHSQACAELSIQSLLGSEYFGSDGIWLYDVPNNRNEEDATFREVAKAHPVLRRWVWTIKDFANAARLDIHVGTVTETTV